MSVSLTLFFAENWPATMSASQFFSIMPSAVLMAGAQFWFWFRFIGATVFVALLAYYVLRLMGGARARQFGRVSGRNLQLIDSISVGVGTSIQIVKAGDKYLVISVSKERVTLLTEVENLELAEEIETNFDPSQVPFGTVLARFMKPKDPNSTGDEN